MECKSCIALLALLVISINGQQESEVDWNANAQETLSSILGRKKNENIAKNVILFLGDGMGISTVTAARIYKGQLANRTGEETELAFERFPHVGLSKTYNVDHQVADSAGTATAFLCGVKTIAGVIGVNQKVKRSNCPSEGGNDVTSILDWSHSVGKSSGLVATARITHATPAAAYAHSAERNWESDSEIPERDRDSCHDIALQLVRDNGHIQEWRQARIKQGQSHAVFWNQSGFDSADATTTDYMLGLFEPSHMQYELDRDADKAGEPSLADMTEKAINVLKRNDEGFFLLVEGGRIDHAHHDNKAKKALHDAVAFDEAVERAVGMTDSDDTLIVVTADHSHVFTIAGYPDRGNPILGIRVSNKSDIHNNIPLDDMPHLTLGYADGPGPARSNLTGIDTYDKDFVFPSAIPLKDESHGGEDVAIYATGPMSHLFEGVVEQHYIAHAMAYASCVGMNHNHCLKRDLNVVSVTCGADQTTVSFILSILLLSCHLS